jgi:superfamily I DNA/RNA helicase
MGFKFLRSCARGGNKRLSEIVREFCQRIGFLNDQAEDFEARMLALNGIGKILDDYDEIYGDWQISARINGVLRFLGTQAADEYRYHSFLPKDPDQDAVQVMTVHKSKGLEFHSVFLPELTRREFPVSNMGGRKYYHVLGGVFEQNKEKYQSDLEDERKLFYVAVTRAKKNLYLTYELSSQPVSDFVAESAESYYLKINREDLHSQWEEERRHTQEYWAAVQYARSQLLDYYGTACHFCPAAHGDLMKLKTMSPDELLQEARYNGLI